MPVDRTSAAHLATARVRKAVETGDGVTRGELAAALDLPLGTVTTAATALLRAGVLIERPVAADHPSTESSDRSSARSAGRPPVLLVAAGPTRTVGAVIWTHGRLQVAVATYGGTVLARAEFDVAGDVTQPDVLEPAREFLRRPILDDPDSPGPTLEHGPGSGPSLEHGPGHGRGQDHGFAALEQVVIGVPAPFQRGVGLPPGRLPVPDVGPDDTPEPPPAFAPWLRTDPAGALGERFGTPVVVENDANLGALGEAYAGAGRGHRSVVYLKIGERSVGAGLVLDGALYRGASGFAGELAHIHVDDDGPLCSCGSRGCLTSRTRQPLAELMQSAYDRPLTFADVLRLAAADEPAPARVLRDLGRTLGRPLADLCTFLNPGIIVLDGGLGPAGRHVLAGLAEQIDRYAAPAAAASLRLEQGTLGADADIAGAIRLAGAEARGELGSRRGRAGG